MILDNIEQLRLYEAAGYDGAAVEAFIERARREQLPEGRYELDGDKLFAMIQEYETKDREECLYESHRLYGDIQYLVSGQEMIYAASVKGLKLVEDRTPDSDILFYAGEKEEAALMLKPGMFAIFLPQDGHMPCCRCDGAQSVRKIVFKFRK